LDGLAPPRAKGGATPSSGRSAYKTVERILVLDSFTPIPETSVNSSIMGKQVIRSSRLSEAKARSSAAARTSRLLFMMSFIKRGSYASRNRMGERGQPCLTPLLIEMVRSGARSGETITSVRRLRTVETNQDGKPCFASVSKM